MNAREHPPPPCAFGDPEHPGPCDAVPTSFAVVSAPQTSQSWKRLCAEHCRRRHARDANGQKQHLGAEAPLSPGNSIVFQQLRPSKARSLFVQTPIISYIWQYQPACLLSLHDKPPSVSKQHRLVLIGTALRVTTCTVMNATVNQEGGDHRRSTAKMRVIQHVLRNLIWLTVIIDVMAKQLLRPSNIGCWLRQFLQHRVWRSFRLVPLCAVC